MIIKLHGYLGETFTTAPIELMSKDIGEIVRMLIHRFGDKFQTILEEGQWHLIKGAKTTKEVAETDNFISEQSLGLPVLDAELHIFPAIVGAGGKGVGQIILGVILIVVAVVAAVYTGGASIAGAWGALSAGGTITAIAVAGVMSVAGGIMAMMTKTPSMASYESAAAVDQRASFIFNGVVNNTEQGVPVPLVYGRHLTGSTIIYAGMDVEQL